MQVYPCPICDRQQSRGGVPFHDPAQTKAHIDGAHDVPHKDERGADYEAELEPVDVDSEDAMTDTYGEESSGPPSLKVDSAFIGEDTAITNVVEMHDEILKEPQAFGLAGGEDVSTLIRENAELRHENDDLRESVQELYEAVDLLADHVGGAVEWEEREVYDPVEEFE